MKKSLVITTIATVLVIVVALTTATFAWFSSSNQTTATSSFAAQTTNAVFTFYPWLSNQNNYDYGNGQTTLDFTTATDTSDASGKFGIFTTTDMKAYVPTAVIDATTPKTMTDNWAGLPGEQFYTANVSGKELNNAYLTALKPSDNFSNGGAPNVARFLLLNGKTEQKKVDITVTVTAQGKTQDIGVADGLRFVMIGVPYNSNSGQAFVIGTEYAYDGIPESVDLTSTHTFTPEAYSSARTDADESEEGFVSSYNGFTGYAKLVEPVSVGVNTSGTNTYTYTNADSGILIDAQKAYEVYLYVWLDGSVITDGSAGGAVSFAINFTDPDAQQGS